MQGALNIVSVVLGGLLSFSVGTLTAQQSQPCTRVWTIPELVRDASRLDGRLVCVRSLLRPLPAGDRRSSSLFVYEAVPLVELQQHVAGYRVGLVDWDKSLGIDEAFHNPESEEKLREAAKRCPGTPVDDLSFTAEFRAVVEYKKGITARAYAALPPTLLGEMPRRTYYDVELVFLEVLKATAKCKK